MENNMNEDMYKLAHFMIAVIGKNKDKAITNNGADWDFVSSKVWNGLCIVKYDKGYKS
jgi:hypothetical protein